MDSKNKLRKYAKKLRKNIVNKELKEKIIMKKILNNENVIKNLNILIYIQTDLEVATEPIIQELFKLRKNVYIPKICDNEIKFYKIESLDNLVISKYNIKEPLPIAELKNDKAVIIVPGLLFDKNFNRLGYGGGYYDKFLKNKNYYKIGVCFSEFLIDKLETENHDIKMDIVITEK